MEGVTFYEMMLESDIYKACGKGDRGKLVDSEVIITSTAAIVSEKIVGKEYSLAKMKRFRIRTNPEPSKTQNYYIIIVELIKQKVKLFLDSHGIKAVPGLNPQNLSSKLSNR